MDLQMLTFFFLVTVAAGGVAWAVLQPFLSGERQAEKRKESLVRLDSDRIARAPRVTQKLRREQIEESLKELEARQKKVKNPPLSLRISRAGLSWSKRQFILASIGLGAAVFLLSLSLQPSLPVTLALTFAAGFGVPRWVLHVLTRRRESRFLDAFPDAVDVIVRGVKAGLPLLECIKIVANEAPEPVRSEFRAIVDAQTVGVPLGEACAKLYERMPLPECNFFGIVVNMQQRSGGNLSEALGNLSRVLRDRKRMKAKIRALSMEAKASAAIIACLPAAVMILVYLTSPKYIELLWIEPLGRVMLAGCVVWMTIGVLVMRKMINFDF